MTVHKFLLQETQVLMTETYFQRTLACSLLKQYSPSLPMLLPHGYGKPQVVRDFNIHCIKCWNSHFIAPMKSFFFHTHDLLLLHLFYEKALIVREFPEGIVSCHIFLNWGIYSLLTSSVPNMSAHITHHFECFLLISWVYVLFPNYVVNHQW